MTEPADYSSNKLPSIYDVAREAGVSPSTVSRVFSKPGRVRSETADRVLQVAARLGYRERAQTRSLGSKSTGVIAFFLTDIANPGYLGLIRGAQEAAAEADLTLLLTDTQESPERERAALERILSSVDGFVLTSSRMTDSAIRMIAKQRPLVMLNRTVKDVPSVVLDNPSAVTRALEHLSELGHTSVTYLAGPENSWANGVRWASLRTAAQDMDLKVRRAGPLSPTFNGGVRGAELWRQYPTSAVIAFNDMVAVGFIRAATSMGRQVPRDVSVVGFDNANIAEIVTPRLTTVTSSMQGLGATAVRELLAIARGAAPWKGQPLVLPVTLIARESTGPAVGGISDLVSD